MNNQSQDVLSSQYKSIGPAYLTAAADHKKTLKILHKNTSAQRYEACTD